MRKYAQSLTLAGFVCLALAVGCGGPSSGLQCLDCEPHSHGELWARGGRYVFPRIAPGDEVEGSVTVENPSWSQVIIDHVDIVADDTAGTTSPVPFHPIGDEGWNTPVTVQKRSSFELPIALRLGDRKAHHATLVFHLSDAVRDTVEVPIASQRPRPSIYCRETLIIDRVRPSSSMNRNRVRWHAGWRELRIHNYGELPLKISRIHLRGSSRFRLTFPESYGDPEPGPIKPTRGWPVLLQPPGYLDVRVHFRPLDKSPAHGELVIESNDPVDPRFVVELSGNPDGP